MVFIAKNTHYLALDRKKKKMLVPELEKEQELEGNTCDSHGDCCALSFKGQWLCLTEHLFPEIRLMPGT